MKLGLIGLPLAGKSTLFRLLTGAAPPEGGGTKGAVGIARVPDPRVDTLAALYNPRKVTYATMTVMEAPGLIPSAFRSRAAGLFGLDPKSFVDALKDVDALVYVVRAFHDPATPHVRGEIDPAQDLTAIAHELLLADWQLIETRLERLQAAKKRQPDHELQLATLNKAQAALEQETPLFAVDFDEQERRALKGYTLFTDKPALVAVNLDDQQLAQGDYPQKEGLASAARAMGAPVVEFAALVESEIAELDPEDRKAFMDDLGLTRTGVERLALAAYARLGLLSYFTVGEDEVRAWTVRKGADAREAAGAIHSDIARGFIRAEVASYAELVAAGGWNALKQQGRIRLEGRDYIVQDGDVMSFRFNV